jgi:hypothetical protein
MGQVTEPTSEADRMTKPSKYPWSRILRISLLFGTVLGLAGLAWSSKFVVPDIESQPRLFLQLLITCLMLGVVLAITGRIGGSSTGARIPKLAGGTPKAADDEPGPTTIWRELLTLEYGKGADRYENIYKAIWLNFSYAVAVGAAIITFGATKLRLDVLQFVALCPIVFWFVATFIPMNHYGELTRGRLRDIETDLNCLFFVNEKGEQIKYEGGGVLGFRHFARFGDARALWRVGDVVYIT